MSPTPDEIRAMGKSALDRIVEYYACLRERPVRVPSTSREIRDLLDEPLPQEPTSFDALLEKLDEVVVRYSRHNAHPRFFGYISSPGTPVTAIGSMLASTLNINVTCWRSGPPATEMEHLTINWLKEMLGYPEQAMGLFVSGGSMANFAGMSAARSAKAGTDVVHDGVAAVPHRLTAYVSDEGHFSIRKAAGMLGLGENSVRLVRTNDRQQVDLDHLEQCISQDAAAGHLPFLVIANAGTTATGAFDPIGEIAQIARRHNLWLHVDAAYGGFAALAPSARHHFEHIAEADSVALDPHKWLYLPVGCGCVLYKDAATARAAFSHDADYTRPIGLEHDEAFAFWDYGPELSRPFRALDLWLLIKSVGAKRLAEAVEQNIHCARYFAGLVQASDDCEMLAPVELSVFCFRYAPRGFPGDLNQLNEQILVNLQRGGSSYLSNAMVDGKFALRGCVLNYRTTEQDMEILLEDVRKAAATVPR
jgi:glutamate/tyrosine decarboxylase-like PLP-dependent enzyme